VVKQKCHLQPRLGGASLQSTENEDRISFVESTTFLDWQWAEDNPALQQTGKDAGHLRSTLTNMKSKLVET
jgi:hypothetical protein